MSEITKQKIFEGTESYRNMERIIREVSCHKIFVVAGGTFHHSILPDFLAEKNFDYCVYDSFQPNPTYEDVLEGLKVFRENNCDFLVSIGGGSAIDIAKCIKAFAAMDDSGEYINQDIPDSGIKHLAMPTTAGTGSESTQFAFINYNGEKVSMDSRYLLPEYAILDRMLLATLPDYPKKAALFQALCHATESYWSVNANKESRAYAREAINIILRYGNPYIRANENMIKILHAANLAGRAVNITGTGLVHAMGGKMASHYGISHGHAAALCMPYVWEHLMSHTDCLQEGQEKEGIKQALLELNTLYKCKTTEETIAFFRGMIVEFELSAPEYKPDDVDILAALVEEQTIKKYPAAISREELAEIYRHILSDTDQLTIREQLQYNVVSELRRIESLTGEQQRKTLGFGIHKEPRKRRVEAAGMLIEAVAAYENSDGSDKEELKQIVSEFVIALNGYLRNREADRINYRNAREKLEKYRIPLSESESVNVEKLKDKYQISNEHAAALACFLKLAERWKDADVSESMVFDVPDNEINTSILWGMLYQFKLLPEGDDACKDLDYPSDKVSIYRMVLLWKNAKTRLYDSKYNRYLTELRKVQIGMMDEIARVCDENNLTYVLNYGSLLGAVRHKGYIPWDDDMDICMPREDYEKFLEIGKKELRNGCYLHNSENFRDCWGSITKVMKKETLLVRYNFRYGEEDGQRIFIDVWPLDNVPGPANEAARRMKKTKSSLTGFLRLKVKARSGVKLNRTQKIWLLLSKCVSEEWLIKKRHQVVTKWRDMETDYWMSGGVYSYIKETMPKAWYLPTTTLTFEGHEYKFPGNYEEVLKHLYGNYMQLPPISKRYTHTPFKVQMEKDGEIMYFNETSGRLLFRGFLSKMKERNEKFLEKLKNALAPTVRRVKDALTIFSGIFRGITPNGRRLLSYKGKYAGKTCYVIEDGNAVTAEEAEAMKQAVTLAGGNCYRLFGEGAWEPDFYCISKEQGEDVQFTSDIRHFKNTKIFYTASLAKGKKEPLKNGIRVAVRKTGKKPQAVGRMDKSYFDNGAGNFIFLLEMAVYMGFSKIIVVGADRSYETYYMHHFADTEKLINDDRKYQSYRNRRKRYVDIVQATRGRCEITEYGDKKQSQLK